MNNKLLNNIAVDLVKDKVMDDKMKEYTEEMEREQNEANNANTGLDGTNLPDLDEVDSEEERIMKRETEKMKEVQDTYIEKEKKKLARKYGDYREILETEFLDIMLKNENVICHFYHNEFERCKIMDKHMTVIAEQHPESLFVKINAEKTPFFTEKLNVRVLPTVVMIKDGKCVDRVVGFEELGMKDDFPTLNLIRRFVKGKVVKPLNNQEKGQINISKAGKKVEDENSDIDD